MENAYLLRTALTKGVLWEAATATSDCVLPVISSEVATCLSAAEGGVLHELLSEFFTFKKLRLNRWDRPAINIRVRLTALH